MSDRFKLFDVVRLIDGLTEEGIAPGTTAAIIDVHEKPSLAYEIEVVDEATGRTVWWGPVRPDQIEAVADSDLNSPPPRD